MINFNFSYTKLYIMKTKFKSLSLMLLALVAMYSCQHEDINLANERENISFKAENMPLSESINHFSIDENGMMSGSFSKEVLDATIKQHYGLRQLSKESYPLLLINLLKEEFPNNEFSSNGKVAAGSTETIFVLAEVTVNGTTYTNWKYGDFNDNWISANYTYRAINIPIGSVAESYVVWIQPNGSPNDIILSQKYVTLNSNMTCDGDEAAEARAYWQYQSAITTSQFRCDD